MTPEHVKISHAVPWPVQPGIIIPDQYIPAHEVGAIIKSAMLVQFESDTADNEHLFHEFEKERQAWLAKADELEKMK